MGHLRDESASGLLHVVLHQWEAALACLVLVLLHRLRASYKSLTRLLLCTEQLELPRSLVRERWHRVHVFCQVGRGHRLFLCFRDSIVETRLLITLELLHTI